MSLEKVTIITIQCIIAKRNKGKDEGCSIESSPPSTSSEALLLKGAKL